MKATGIVRKIDDLGRIVLPKELRENLRINTKEALEIYVDGENVVLKKYEVKDACIFCGTIEKNPQKLFGKSVCKRCAEVIVKNKAKLTSKSKA